MFHSGRSISLGLLAALGCMASVSAKAQSIPTSTAIPVSFLQTIEAGKAKTGSNVLAKTTQVVTLPGGQVIAKGTILIGHVVESTPFVFSHAPYAVQNPSVLSIHFDRIEVGSTIPVNLSVRAIAGPVASREASILHFRDETDSTGTRILVGGNQFSPLESEVISSRDELVGYNRKQGVFARLLASDYVSGESTIHCDSTNSEQSIGVFSASACGVYDLSAASIVDNGSNGRGTFSLQSRRDAVKLYAASEALLQVI